MSVDLDHLREWEGREEIAFDTVTLAPMAALAATLDREDKVEHGSRLPELWHWLYFLPLHRQSELAPDGHAHRGGFLPPVPLPRRMWAGSRVEIRVFPQAGLGAGRPAFGAVIDDDGLILSESGAIVLYLAEKAGKLDPKAIAATLHGLTITPAQEPNILMEATWNDTGDIDRISFLGEVKDGKQVITETLPKLGK